MATIEVTDPAREVLNQAPPLQPVNLFEVDLALQEALEREGGGWGVDRAREAGAVAGSAEAREHSRRAERNLPILRTHDRFGNRIDEVELDPSWHWLLRGAIEREIHSLPWRERAAGCARGPRGAVLAVGERQRRRDVPGLDDLRGDPGAARRCARTLAAEWEPRLTKPDYDDGALAGMAMTERQGGSDVRANITRAEPVGDGVYEIHGHKWFCSYPPCDVFLVLAQAPGGLSCFLVERGAGMEFQRLKDKLGTRSLPSSEVEFRGAHGRLIGEEGRGVPAIIRMVNHTRLDCLLGSRHGPSPRRRSRRSTTRATAPRSERCSSTSPRCATCSPTWRSSPRRRRSRRCGSRAATTSRTRPAFRRFATAVMKYWVSKRAPAHAAEALECLGGNGFVEDSGMPLLYRDAPLNSIWEGSGNVAALDVLRAMVKEPEGLPAFMAECELGAGGRRQARRPPRTRSASAPRLPSPARTRSSWRGGSSRSWRSRCRRRCWSATRRRRSPTRSARPGSAASPAACTARSRPASTRARSSIARCRHERRHLRGHRAGRTPDAQPPRARQRDHPRPRHRARAVRRAGRPRPGGPRAPAVRQRQGVLRRLRPGRERRGPGRSRHGRGRCAAWLAAGPAGDDGQPRSCGYLGPDGRLRDDEPQRPRVHVAVPLHQAGRLQGPRILRRRRHGHGAVLGPARDRRRREDRLPAGAGVGIADDFAVGLPARSAARQAAAVHGRLADRASGAGVGAGDRGAGAGGARRADGGARGADRDGCRSTSSR